MRRERPHRPEVLPSPCVPGPTLTDLGAALRPEAPAHGAVGTRPARVPSLHVLPPGRPEKTGKRRASLKYARWDGEGAWGRGGGGKRRDREKGAGRWSSFRTVGAARPEGWSWRECVRGPGGRKDGGTAGQGGPGAVQDGHSRDGSGQQAADSRLGVPGTVGVPGKDAVHAALVDTTVGSGNLHDAS